MPTRNDTKFFVVAFPSEELALTVVQFLIVEELGKEGVDYQLYTPLILHINCGMISYRCVDAVKASHGHFLSPITKVV